jgi:HlyD family secretion protein
VLHARQPRIVLLDRRLEDTVLLAPAKGIIQSRILELGEMAMPSRPAFTLALTDPKWVRVYLPEPQLGWIDRGMRAQVYSDSFKDRPFDGWVGFISPQAEFTPKSVETTDLRTQLVYETRIWVDDPANELRLGMPVTVEIDIAQPPQSPGNAAPDTGSGDRG